MTHGRGFGEFLESRDTLAASMASIASSLETVPGGGERAKQMLAARENLLADAFRLMVVGEFKRGKSTLVNSLLGQEVLPARVAPCTAIITEVHYADQPYGVIHHHDQAKSPGRVKIEELRKYVTIDDDADDDDDDPSGIIGKSPYSLMELYYPLPLCKNNVIIVDSPGLNEHKTRTKVAMDFLSRADALVLVLSCQQALSDSELSFIDAHLGNRNLSHVFFVWNHYDAIVDSPDDIEDIRKRSRKYLESRIGSNNRVYYVSARSGLLGKKTQDRKALDRSGLPPFESALESFLANDRGRVKLAMPLRMAETAVREALSDLIPGARSMLSQPIEKLTAAYEEQKPRLADAESQRDRLLRTVERRRDALIREARGSYQNFVSQIELEIGNEVETIELGLKDTIISRKDSQKKVADHLQNWLDQRCRSWQQNELSVIFTRAAEELEADIEEQALEFVQNIDRVRQALTPSLSVVTDEQDISGANRMLSTVGGFLVGGLGSAIEGASMGFKGMAKGLAVNIAVSVGLAVAGFGLPIILPVLAAIGIARTLMGAQSMADQLKGKITTELLGELRKNVPATTAKIENQVTEEFTVLLRKLDGSMRIMIDEIAVQVQTILKAKQEGESRMREELERLSTVSARLSNASKQLDKVRYEIDNVVAV